MTKKTPPEAVSLLADVKRRFSEDGTEIMLEFINHDEESFFTGMRSENLNKFVGSILNLLAELGQRAKPEYLAGKIMPITPVPAASIQLANSPTDGEIIISFQVGPATVSFSVETEMLQDICVSLAAQRPQRRKRSVN